MNILSSRLRDIRSLFSKVTRILPHFTHLAKDFCEFADDTCESSPDMLAAIVHQHLYAGDDLLQDCRHVHLLPYTCHCKGCSCADLCRRVATVRNSQK